ncbi:antitoxin [Frankia sp. Cppng1_Ct_nod]|uniref:antitoxin n=1 Tax=Frankia sp. Cppng1_Ct_nod TaxID=2897162 RepID=UPI001041ADFA|nr:antitoxin [Frankia sp. Cppng1_Ct_nod]
MRTTVTLDPDVAIAIREVVRERGVSFKEALNTLIRTGLASRHQDVPPYRTPTRSLGLRPDVNLDKALRLSSELEDAEIISKLELRK